MVVGRFGAPREVLLWALSGLLALLALLPVSVVRVGNGTVTSRDVALCVSETCRDERLAPNDAAWMVRLRAESGLVRVLGDSSCSPYHGPRGTAGLYNYDLGTSCGSWAFRVDGIVLGGLALAAAAFAWKTRVRLASKSAA